MRTMMKSWNLPRTTDKRLSLSWCGEQHGWAALHCAVCRCSRLRETRPSDSLSCSVVTIAFHRSADVDVLTPYSVGALRCLSASGCSVRGFCCVRHFRRFHSHAPSVDVGQSQIRGQLRAVRRHAQSVHWRIRWSCDSSYRFVRLRRQDSNYYTAPYCADC